MLTAVLLHPAEPFFPVDGTFRHRTHFQGRFTEMDHGFSPFPGILHPDAV